MAGAADRDLLRVLQDRDWVRPSRFHRALIVTPAGRDGLAARFGIAPAELDRATRLAGAA